MTIRNKRALIFAAIIAVSLLSTGSVLRAGMDCIQSIKICERQLGAIQEAIDRAKAAGALKAVEQLQQVLIERRTKCAEKLLQACG